MAKDESKRLPPGTIADDEAAFNALRNVTGYAPSNASYAITAITQARDDMNDSRASEDQAAADLKTARDVAASNEWAFHNLILGAKDQVRGQFGKDSAQVQAIGLKRKSEYKSPGPRRKAPPS